MREGRDWKATTKQEDERMGKIKEEGVHANAQI